MHRLRLLPMVLLVALACGDDGGTSDGSAEASADGPTSTSGPTSSTSNGSMSSSTTAPANPCSGPSDCADDEYCDFPFDSCGAGGAVGDCLPRPTGCETPMCSGADCTKEERFVCGCDNADFYATTCHAAAAGVDTAFLGTCAAPAGGFRCGPSLCISGLEYCLEQGGTMPTWDCIELPPVCQPTECTCITTCCGCENATCCSQYCEKIGEDLVYTCPGE